MEKLKFSVITVSYNHGEFIRKTIDSVLDQNYENFEHIIVDGGSTDNTLSILKEYPHLKWTSEPDRGQTHALEKGFRSATGDIIAWINSDDWYAPNIFHPVAKELEQYPILLSKTVKTDKAGNPEEEIPNIERSWFQLLKYWSPHAWISQPGVFFRRHLLEECKHKDGKYLDEDLYYIMDYDLWMRMTKKYPFQRRLDQVTAYFRMYDENKTGKEGDATQRECSRVYNRYCNDIKLPERTFSLIIAIDKIDQNLHTTLQSLAAQNLSGAEVVLLGYGDGVSQKDLRMIALEADKAFFNMYVRSAYTESPHLLQAYNHGVEIAAGQHCVFLRDGDTLDPNFLLGAHNSFSIDEVGILLPYGEKQEIISNIAEEMNGVPKLTFLGMLSGPLYSPAMVVRKASFVDVGGFEYPESPQISLRKFLLKAANKSWFTHLRPPLRMTEAYTYDDQYEIQSVFQLYISSKVIVDYSEDFKDDTFYNFQADVLKACLKLDPIHVDNAREVLQKAPPNWFVFDYLEDMNKLNQIINDYPEFSPAYFYRAKLSRSSGDTVSADKYHSQYEALKPNLQ